MADEDISLYNLLNLSITSPGQGTVNFRALYALLHGILRQLDLRDITVSFSDTGPQKSPPEPRTEAEGEPRSRTGGPRETEETEDPPGTGPGSTQESVGDDKHVLELIHRIQKQTEHLQDNVRELRHQQDKASAAQAQWVTSLESHGRRVDALEEAVRRPEEDERYVTWEAMKSALITERQNLHKGLVQTTKDENVTKTEPKTSHVPPPPSKTQTKESGTGTEAKDAPGPGSTPAPPVVPPVASSVVPALKSLSQTACASSLHQETLEALRDIGRLKQRCDGLEERLCALDLERSRERQELLRLRDLLHNTGPDEVFEAMKEELDELRALVRNLLSDRDKGSQRKGSAEEQTAGGSNKDQEPKPGLDPGLDPGLEMFRTEVAEMWREFNKLRVQVRSVQLSLKELRDRVETSPENTEQSLQDQLDDLRGLLTQTMESLSSELRLQVEPVNRVSESSFNLLFQEHEQLKDTDNALLQQQPSTGTETGRDTQSAQLVSEVQKAILLLQTECEKLHETTQCLLEDNQQKQTHIEELYKMTEEMEEKKADKNMVETEIRADKTALDSKVSRVQFDSVTEQLSNMFNELLTKVSDQEQDWSKLMEKLSTEMDCKLNRIELDPVKKQLEARWKSIQERMKNEGAPEQDDAAGIRKQLVERFHCLSCDRPVLKHTPGPQLLTLPTSPSFQPHRSLRPFTVYTLEQIRQHCRSDRVVEVADYSLYSVSRSCGGSHTVTSFNQRQRSSVQHSSQQSRLLAQLDDTLGQSEEVDIVGLDGHIYKGRLNASPSKNAETKLPTIASRDGSSRSRSRPRSSPSPRDSAPSSGLRRPSPPSGCCSSGRDWPVSPLGCASQSSLVPMSVNAAESST